MPYQSFVSSRTTEPNGKLLLATLRTLDSTAGIQHAVGSNLWIVKKDTNWTAQQVIRVQQEIDTAPTMTNQSAAQTEIDNWEIALRALVLSLLDQLNVLRGLHGLTAITPSQALAAVREKAGTL